MSPRETDMGVCSVSKVREVVGERAFLVEIGFEVVHNGVWIGFVLGSGAGACLYESHSHMTTRSKPASRIV